MIAIPGAIYKAEFKKRLILHTINNQDPIGICGTGLIDLISIFLQKREIDPKGQIKNKEKKIKVTGNIFLTQQDIREVQLAVGAIKAGIKTLLNKYHCPLDHLEKIMLAGAFGNHLNISNAKKIGLLPGFPNKDIIFLGNSSLAGAKALLLNKSLRENISSVVSKIKHCSLAKDTQFQEYFIDSMIF